MPTLARNLSKRLSADGLLFVAAANSSTVAGVFATISEIPSFAATRIACGIIRLKIIETSGPKVAVASTG
jgi:hypothetical protein